MGLLTDGLSIFAYFAVIIVRHGKSVNDVRLVAAARFFTALFAVLMVLVAGAFAYAKVTDPNIRIIPIVLGIAGFILGPMLGVFLIGMFTRGRGSDRGNLIAITAGLAVTIVLGDLHTTVANTIAPMLGSHAVFARPEWLPKISFTWFAAVGAAVVFCIGVLLKTPETALALARKREQEAAGEDDRPVDLRT